MVLDLFDQVVVDMDEYMPSHRLISQQLMHRVPSDMVKERMALAEEINRMLSSTIKSLERWMK